MVTLSPSGYHQNRVTLFPLWDSPGAGTLVLNWAQLDLVNLVPIWASPSPRDFVPHLYLIAVDSFLASPRSGDSGPHLWTIMTWILCSTPETHLDMMTLDPLWASP